MMRQNTSLHFGLIDLKIDLSLLAVCVVNLGQFCFFFIYGCLWMLVFGGKELEWTTKPLVTESNLVSLGGSTLLI